MQAKLKVAEPFISLHVIVHDCLHVYRLHEYMSKVSRLQQFDVFVLTDVDYMSTIRKLHNTR